MTQSNQLDLLYGMRKRLDVTAKHFAELEAKIIPPEIQRELDNLRTERQTTIQPMMTAIANLENTIKEKAKDAKTSLEGKYLICVYNPGGSTVKVSDLKPLIAKYEITHPEIAAELSAIINSTSPSSSIRAR